MYSAAVRFSCVVSLTITYYKFSVESNNERILKIGQDLTELPPGVCCLFCNVLKLPVASYR